MTDVKITQNGVLLMKKEIQRGVFACFTGQLNKWWYRGVEAY